MHEYDELVRMLRKEPTASRTLCNKPTHDAKRRTPTFNKSLASTISLSHLSSYQVH